MPKPKKTKIGGWKKTLRNHLFDLAEEGYSDRLKADKARFPGVPKGPKRPVTGRAPESLPSMPSVPSRSLPTKGQAAAAVATALGTGGVVFAASPARSEIFRKFGKSVKKGAGSSPVAPRRSPSYFPGASGSPTDEYNRYGDAPEFYPAARDAASRDDAHGQPTINVFKAPVAIGRESHGHNPRMWAKAKNGDVSVTVEHVEYVRDVTPGGGSAWSPSQNVWQLPINPGSAPLFAWLSDLAGLFDEYEFSKLEFVYQPAVGTDTDGKFLMTFDPDVLDEVPDSKQDMLQARVQVDGMPWHENTLKVPRDLIAGRRYCRGPVVPAGADAHFYDVGALNIAAPGVPAGMIGELFVKYRITFFSPTGGVPKSGTAIFTSGNTPAAPLGLAQNGPPTQAVGTIYPTPATPTAFFFPATGVYFLSVRVIGTGFTGQCQLNPSVSANQTCTIVDSGYTSSSAVSIWICTVNDPTTSVVMVSPTGAATITRVVMRMWEGDVDQNI